MKTAQEIRYLQENYWSPKNQAERIVKYIEDHITHMNTNKISYPYLNTEVIEVLQGLGFTVLQSKDNNSSVISW